MLSLSHAIPEFNPNAADIARQRELDEKNRAFYARFNLSRLHSPSSTAAPTSAPIAVADDELNAAPIPSWFHENEVKWQQAERQKHAKPASSAAAVAATSNASKKRKMPTDAAITGASATDGAVAMEMDEEIKPRHSAGASRQKKRKVTVKEEEKSAVAGAVASSRSPAAARYVARPITIGMHILARKPPSGPGAADSASSSAAAAAVALSSAAVAPSNGTATITSCLSASSLASSSSIDDEGLGFDERCWDCFIAWAG